MASRSSRAAAAARAKARRRRRGGGIPLGRVIALSAAALALIAFFVLVPRARTSVTNFIGPQATREFGTLLGIVPPTTGKALLCMIMDNSGSSTRTMTDARGNAVPYRKRVAEEAVRLSQTLIDDPSRLTDTTIWRLGAREGRFYKGLNDELRLKKVLQEQFVDAPQDKQPGSNFAPALEAALDAYHDYQRDHKDAMLVITLATDGGVTDTKETRRVAEQLARENVLIFVHGIVPQDRLWETTHNALLPLYQSPKRKILDSSLTDFDLHLTELRRVLEARKIVKASQSKQVALACSACVGAGVGRGNGRKIRSPAASVKFVQTHHLQQSAAV